ncbi:MAG: RNA polymerase sigma factor [Candidatus Omnitrophota bacterium]
MNEDRCPYERLIRPIEDRMIRSIWRIVRDPDDTRDALQEALSIIWKRIDRVQEHINPAALILKICVDAAYDALRRKMRRLDHEENDAAIPEIPDRFPLALERLMGEDMEKEIMEAIAQLPRNQASALLMRIVQEHSYADIAQALGCSEATARIHASRARAKLSLLLSHLDPIPARSG